MKIHGFTYREWLERARHDKRVHHTRYKLRKAVEAADTRAQAEWARSLREWAHLSASPEPKQSSASVSMTAEVRTDGD